MIRVVAALALAGCGATNLVGSGRPLDPQEQPHGPATGLRRLAIVQRGVLAYDLAAATTGARSAAIELETGFDLVLLGGAHEQRTRLDGPTYDMLDVALDADARHIAVASLDGTVRVFDQGAPPLVGGTPTSLPNDAVHETARYHLDDAATAVALSPDGTWLVTGAASGILCLRRVADGALFQCVAEHEQRVAQLVFAPDGTRLASAGWDGRVIVWEIPSLRVVARQERPGAALALAFAPDREALAFSWSGARPQLLPTGQPRSAGPDLIEIWRFATDTAPIRLTGHRAPVSGLVFAGATLASVSWDRTLRLWDPATGRELLKSNDFPGILRAVVTLPDQTLLVAGFGTQDPQSVSISRFQLLYPAHHAL